MRLVSFVVDGRSAFGVVKGEGIIDLTKYTRYKTLREGGFSPKRLPDGSCAVDASAAHGVTLVFG